MAIGDHVGDCVKIDTAAAASILGVAKVHAHTLGHHRVQGDVDILSCDYEGEGADFFSPTLTYVVETPTISNPAAQISAEYSGMVAAEHPGLQSFATKIGDESVGWVGSNRSNKFKAQITFRTASNIVEVSVDNMPSSADATTAAQRAAAALQ
jgi:hypothetical protein